MPRTENHEKEEDDPLTGACEVAEHGSGCAMTGKSTKGLKINV